MAFSKYGNIKLGSGKKEHSDFAWGTMMFTAGLAADILFYSLCEWMLYANQDRIQSLGDTTLWSATGDLSLGHSMLYLHHASALCFM